MWWVVVWECLGNPDFFEAPKNSFLWRSIKSSKNHSLVGPGSGSSKSHQWRICYWHTDESIYQNHDTLLMPFSMLHMGKNTRHSQCFPVLNLASFVCHDHEIIMRSQDSGLSWYHYTNISHLINFYLLWPQEKYSSNWKETKKLRSHLNGWMADLLSNLLPKLKVFCFLVKIW